MNPRLGEGFGLEIPAYSAFMILAGVATLVIMAILLRRRGENAGPAVDLGIFMIFCYTLGAHALFALKNGTSFLPEGGRAGYWGGQVAFVLVAGAYFLLVRARGEVLGDVLAVAWAGATVFHKLACFFAGCCHGAPANLAWALVFPHGSAGHHGGAALHPVQLYDAGAGGLLFLLLLLAYRVKKAEGRLLLWWGLGYSFFKFTTEFFRGDLQRPVAEILTISQAIELFAFSGAAFLLLRHGIWSGLLRWRERRRGGPPLPGGAPRARLSFAIGLFVSASALTLALLLPLPAAARGAYVGIFLAANFVLALTPILGRFGARLLDRRGETPGGVRLFVRTVADLVAPFTLLGLLRPLFDREGRSLGDAVAGTLIVGDKRPAN